MTTWGDVIQHGFKNVKEYVDRGFDAFKDRIKALEASEATRNANLVKMNERLAYIEGILAVGAAESKRFRVPAKGVKHDN
jgi:hypothetical protein